MLQPRDLTPLSISYPIPGMLSYIDRPARYLPGWVLCPFGAPQANLGYLLTTMYPGGTTQ